MRRAARAVIGGLLVLGSGSCTRTPAAPTPQVPFAGSWLGELRQASCSHWDVRTCGRSFPSTSTFTLLLVLEQSGERVAGSFELDMVPPPGAIVPAGTSGGAVSGSVIEGTTVRMVGSTFTQHGEANFDVRDWVAQLEPDGRLTGRFTLISESPGPIVQAPLVIEYEMPGLIRIAR